MRGADSGGAFTLAADPEAAAAARRLVGGVLEGLPDEALANAELVVSELVTNAVLHAGTPISLTLTVGPDVVRIEVADDDGGRPTAKEYSAEAGTGRGLHLVEALALDWGIRPGPAGKTVWAEVAVGPGAGSRRPGGGSIRPGAPARGRAPARPAGGTGAGPGPGRGVEVGLTNVHLLDLPVPVYGRAAEHADELLREFALILERRPDQGAGPPGRLLAVIGEIDERFGRFRADAEAALRGAVQEGRQWIPDLVYRVPAEIGPASTRLWNLLDEADAYCRAGDLLTMAAPSQVRAFRHWYLGQFSSQVAGAPAVSWPDWLAGQQA